MRISILIILAYIAISILSSCYTMKNEGDNIKNQQIGVEIDHVFTNFTNEIFDESKDYLLSGWTMQLSSGRKVSREFLRKQASSIVVYGVEAVPHLFKWVMSDNLSVRYIATYALGQITGCRVPTTTFDTEDLAGNREKAIKIWKEWYEQNKKTSNAISK